MSEVNFFITKKSGRTIRRLQEPTATDGEYVSSWTTAYTGLNI